MIVYTAQTIFEILIGFISSFTTLIFWYYSVSAITIEKIMGERGIIYIITRFRLFYTQVEMLNLKGTENLKLKLQMPQRIFHHLIIDGGDTIYIAPATSQGINLVSKILEIFEDFNIDINFINSRKYRTIPTPNGKSIVSISLADERSSAQLDNLRSIKGFELVKNGIEVNNLFVLLTTLLLTILLLSVIVIVPLIKMLYLIKIHDIEYTLWFLLIFVGLGFFYFMVKIFLVELKGTFGIRKILSTKYNLIISYKIPGLKPFLINISKRLDPQIELVPRKFRRKYPTVWLNLYNKSKQKYFSILIAEIRDNTSF